jgi:hypothetical protein
MRFLAKDTKSQDIIAIHSYRRMEHSAIMLDQSFAVRHEAHEGHEERGPDYKGSRISTRIPLPSSLCIAIVHNLCGLRK